MTHRNRSQPPGLTACILCAGDTLGDADDRPGGQLARLWDLERRGCARLSTVECLDVCEEDVLVVRPSPLGRRSGGRPVWFSRLAGDPVTEALAEWLGAGGPGCADVPAGLRDLVVPAPGQDVAG
ncbi:hypothetical protein HJG43_13835 [Kineosporiaceae bacterium SCSIO 59966]|nr:hypothetical protein HJG43_13835 [Kineosporiaceae bacterium SCSIO 59966]